MNITQTIKKIYPELEFGKDFIVFDNSDGKGQQLKWLNKDIKKPTNKEFSEAWGDIKKTQERKNVNNNTKQKIISEYPIEKQLTYIIRELSGDKQEFQKMASHIINTLSEGKREKNKL